MDFLIISSLFSFLYFPSSITGEVANKKFWKNHRVFLHTPTVSYPNFSLVRSLQFKKWISWLLAHYFHFYIFPILLLENRERKILEKTQIIATYTHCIIYKFQLNPFTTAQEMDFLIVSSLFSFLYLSSSISGEVGNEKFWKNHRVLLHTPTILYTNYSSIHSQ